MSESQGLHIEQRQRMHLSQQQVRFARMLELSTPELEEAVAKELADNPALEVKVEPELGVATDDGGEFRETPEQLQRADYASAEDMLPSRHVGLSRGAESAEELPEFSPADTEDSLYDDLNRQLGERALSKETHFAALQIVGNLDSNGYLRRTLHGISDDVAFDSGEDLPVSRLESALAIVQSLDPAGIGARDLQECLKLQLERLDDSAVRRDALQIVNDGFEAFSMKHFHKLVSQLKMSQAQVRAATELILTLNPKPGASVGTGLTERAQPVIPDYLVDIRDGEITIQLNNRIPELQISESFETAVKRMNRRKAVRPVRGQEFFAQRYNDARDFMGMLARRQETLFAVATAIVERQKEYFLTEDVHSLKPLGIKDVAEATGLDLSAVSRATNNKYMSTPQGILPLRFFFHDSLGGEKEGEWFTAKAVQDVLKRLVAGEDKRHPLSDERLRELLKDEGYEISRRTVAKYRDRLRIPVARLRRQ